MSNVSNVNAAFHLEPAETAFVNDCDAMVKINKERSD